MQTSSQSILLAGVDINWLTSLQERFEGLGHQVQVFQGVDFESNSWLRHDVNIVIVVDNPRVYEHLQGWRSGWSYEHPLVVLLSDGVDASLDVDIVLGFDTDMLEQQILACYRMHQRAQVAMRENKSLHDDLTRQHKMMNEFEVLKNAIVRNISHELKTPLLQMKSAISLLSEENESKLVTYATNATAKLEVLIKNITMLGTSLDVNLVPTIPRDVVESAKRSIFRIWEHKGAENRIIVQMGDELAPVMADKQGLNTVLQLLLDNALKFSKETVVIRVEKDGDDIFFSVKDRGIGIMPEKLEEIFGAFVQLDNSSTRRYGGIGVGLALVKLILDHHGTHIVVESTIGKGSCFSFRLPVMKNWRKLSSDDNLL